MKKLALLLAIPLLLCGCGDNTNSKGDSKEEQTEVGFKHYEINLDSSNYSSYLNCTYTKTGNYYTRYVCRYDVAGVLNYALYKDVEIVFNIRIFSDGPIEYTSTTVDTTLTANLKLNAAGCGEIHTTSNGTVEANGNSKDIKIQYFDSCDKEMTIKSISGTVIFDI